eukprot:29988-Pelagococcus_subviridis.AAC.2
MQRVSVSMSPRSPSTDNTRASGCDALRRQPSTRASNRFPQSAAPRRVIRRSFGATTSIGIARTLFRFRAFELPLAASASAPSAPAPSKSATSSSQTVTTRSSRRARVTPTTSAVGTAPIDRGPEWAPSASSAPSSSSSFSSSSSSSSAASTTAPARDATHRARGRSLRAVPYKATSGWS